MSAYFTEPSLFYHPIPNIPSSFPRGQASSNRPAFDEIKMRYAIGKQTFYESHAIGSPKALRRSYASPQELSRSEIGHMGDFKSMFSEFSKAATRDAMERRIKRLGFELVEKKRHVSIHLQDYGGLDGAVAGIVVSLCIMGKKMPTCTVRKIKTSTAKVGCWAAHCCDQHQALVICC